MMQTTELLGCSYPVILGGAQAEQARQLPPADFNTLLNSLAMQTVMALQGMEDPNTKQRLIDLQLAKFHIDLLGVLDEKTKGNLNEEEATLMERSLAELRLFERSGGTATPEMVDRFGGRELESGR